MNLFLIVQVTLVILQLVVLVFGIWWPTIRLPRLLGRWNNKGDIEEPTTTVEDEGKKEEERGELEKVFFAKEGQVMPVEEFREVVYKLDLILQKSRSLPDFLARVDELEECSDHYMHYLNYIPKRFPKWINVVNYAKYQQDKYYKRCRDSMLKDYAEAYDKLEEKLKADTGELRQQVKLASEGQFKDSKPFYQREALVNGLLAFLKTRPDKLAKRIKAKKSVKKEKFKDLFTSSIVELCTKLFNDESAKQFVGRSKFYLKQVGEDQRLVEYFDSNFKDYISRVNICKEVTDDTSLEDDVYEASLCGQKKSLLDNLKKPFCLNLCGTCRTGAVKER